MAVFHRSGRTKRASNGTCVSEDGASKKNGRGKRMKKIVVPRVENIYRN